MTEPETTQIRPADTRREWLLRCNDKRDDIAVCAVSVYNGAVEIQGPDNTLFSLDHTQISDFHAALHDAITQAEADLREPRQVYQATA